MQRLESTHSGGIANGRVCICLGYRYIGGLCYSPALPARCPIFGQLRLRSGTGALSLDLLRLSLTVEPQCLLYNLNLRQVRGKDAAGEHGSSRPSLKVSPLRTPVPFGGPISYHQETITFTDLVRQISVVFGRADRLFTGEDTKRVGKGLVSSRLRASEVRPSGAPAWRSSGQHGTAFTVDEQKVC